jgi:hypothetical protein
MSVGSNNLQEMENAVTKGAAKADAMPSLTGTTPGQTGSYEDLGGPTPQNYSPTDDSAKLKTPGTTLKQVKDVVNKGAKPADAMPGGKMEETEIEGDVVAEDEVVTDEVVSEEETTTDEVVAESEESEEEITEEETAEVEIDIEADINALVEGEDLSEDFKAKAATIFEAAINSKVQEISEQITAQYEEKLVEEIASIKEELKDRVDSYLEYVADEWVQENELAVQSGLKEEMTESFISGMKSLFEEHYVTIPEEKYDVIESMVDKLDEMEGKLNEQIEKNIALNKRLAESVSDVVFADVTEGLAQTQKDKLASLVENVEFESEEAYREKLGTLRESYFPTQKAQRSATENLTEEAGSPVETTTYSPSMEAYLKTLSRVSKK